jgi:hypothetical protein
LARFLQMPYGCSHVREVVIELWGERDIDSIEQTITRRINDFCSRVTQKGPEEVLHRRGLSACPKSGDYKEAPPDQVRASSLVPNAEGPGEL